MLRQPLVGLIYATVLTRRVRPLPVLYRLPTVLLNCFVQDHSFASIVPGELLGGYVATLCLIRAGHRRIGHIHGQSWTDPSRDRMKGYRRALAEHDILFDPALVRPGNWEPPPATSDGTLMELADPPTAIFFASDMMAFGCYQALKERGLRMPQDVSVVGYDDREIAQFMRPALTTVVLPHSEMGLQAAEALIDGLLRPEGRQPQIKVECTLVERGSVGSPRSAPLKGDAMLVLVTGATGKVGRALIARLQAEPEWAHARIRALCHNRVLPATERVEVVRGSIADRDVAAGAIEGVTHVVHLATCKETPERRHGRHRQGLVLAAGGVPRRPRRPRASC